MRFKRPTKRALTMRHLSRDVPDLRVILLLRTGGHCWYCGSILRLATVTIDHVVPVKQGGKTILANLHAACQPCNTAKAGLSLEDYRVQCGRETFWGEHCAD